MYTSDGEIARHFTNAKIGMVGVNVPIQFSMAAHSFGGWKQSLFGDHAMRVWKIFISIQSENSNL